MSCLPQATEAECRRNFAHASAFLRALHVALGHETLAPGVQLDGGPWQVALSTLPLHASPCRSIAL
jgi:hypothetical protein